MTITLPVPEYSPNRRQHWSKEAKLKKAMRTTARVETLNLLNGSPPPCPVAYSLVYYWPARPRDDDNAIASVKPYMDGICDTLGVDDRHIRFRELIHRSDRKRPRLEVVIHTAERKETHDLR